MVRQHHYLLLENNCSPQNTKQWTKTHGDISGIWCCVGMTTNKKSTRINRFIEYHYLWRGPETYCSTGRETTEHEKEN